MMTDNRYKKQWDSSFRDYQLIERIGDQVYIQYHTIDRVIVMSPREVLIVVAANVT